MSSNGLNRHLVCTYDEARSLIGSRDSYFVSNCGCRERKGRCLRSRMDVCLTFAREISVSGSNKKEIDKAGAHALLAKAVAARLVARPFRKDEHTDEIGGICFCCDDCCGVFLSANEHCDRGKMIETTAAGECTHCGACVEYCYFSCRGMLEGRLGVDREKCYGCGICVEICPVGCIGMIER